MYQIGEIILPSARVQKQKSPLSKLVLATVVIMLLASFWAPLFPHESYFFRQSSMKVVGGDTAYVTNSGDGTVTPINISLNPPVAGTPINLPTGSTPNAIAITPDDTTAWVTDSTNNVMYPLNLTVSPPVVGTSVSVGSDPVSIAISPDGTKAYVLDANPSGASGYVTPFDLATTPPTPLTSIAVGKHPQSLTLNPAGDVAYVEYTGQSITQIELPSGTLGNVISLGVGTYNSTTSFTPDGLYAYLNDGIASDVTVVSTAAQSVSSTVGLPVGDISNVVVSPNGNYAYAADMTNNDVTPIATSSGTVGNPIYVDQSPGPMAFGEGGAALAVLNLQGDSSCGAYGSNGSVTVINTLTNVASSPVCVGSGASAIAIMPTPQVTHVSPSSGSFSGGELVTISGSGFLPGSVVYFGSQPASGESVVSSTEITATVPPSSPSGTTPTVDISVSNLNGSSALNDADLFAYGRDSAYVVDQTSGEVTPITTSTSPQSTIPNVSVGTAPESAALSSDGQTLYVANSTSGTISPIDTSTNTVGSAITVSPGVNAIAVTPDGKLAVVTDGSTNFLYTIDLTTSPPIVYPAVTVCNDPVAVEITPDGLTAYVVCEKDNTVVPVDIRNTRAVVGQAIGVGNEPVAIAISPDGTTALIVNSNSASASGSVTPIFLGSTPNVGSTFAVGATPDAIAITPDGTEAVVANRQDDTIDVIDMSTMAIIANVSVGASPSAVAIVNGGNFADVTNANDNTVTPIDLTSDTADPTISVGTNPVAIVANEAPSVLSITPASGSNAGGAQVAITGSGFTPETQVFFAGTQAPYAQVDSASRLTVISPPGSGTELVTVVTANGTSSDLGYIDRFVYLITSSQPIGLVATAGLAKVYSFSVFSNVLGSPLNVGSDPSGIAITPDRSLALVNNGGDGTLTPIDLQTTPPTPETPIDACSTGTSCDPYPIAISPDGSTALVGLSADSTVRVFDIPSQTFGSTISLPAPPEALVFSPDGSYAYVLCGSSTSPGLVARMYLNGSTWELDPNSEVVPGNGSTSMVISSDGTKAYVTNFFDGTVSILDLGTDPIGIEPQQFVITQPYRIAITPNGNTLYVSNGIKTVTPIDLIRGVVEPAIVDTSGAQSGPNAIVVSPDGSTVYVANYNSNEVTPIATASNLPETPMSLPTGASPDALAISSPVEAPSRPRDLQANPVNSGLHISWQPPVFDGGSPITSYVITLNGPSAPAPITVASGVLSYSLSGLINMQGYRVSVQAVNAAGAGEPAISEVVYPQITLGEFVPLPPDRILDTRYGNGTGGVIAPIGQQQTLVLQVAGRGGVPLNGASAVVMNVTAADPTASGFLTVYPDGNSLPVVSNLNLVQGQPAVPNLVTVKLGSGKVDIYNSYGSVDVIADVVGYYTDGTTVAESRYNPLSPARILDTRSAMGSCTPAPCATLGPNSYLTVNVAGAGGVPAGQATGVIMNVTVANPTMASYLTVFPTGTNPPVASNLNYVPGQVVPNLVSTKLGSDGSVTLYNMQGTVDVVIDVMGWYSQPGSINGSRFNALVPERILDTRFSQGSCTPSPCAMLGPKSSLNLQVTGILGSAPAGASGAIMNVTVAAPSSSSFLTLYPEDSTMPVASNLNWVQNQIVPNLVVSKLSSPTSPQPGQVSIYNLAGNVEVIVDISGWFNDGSS